MIGGLVLLGAMVGLWLFMRKADDATASARPTGDTPAPIVASDPPPITTREAPSLPGSGTDVPAAPGSDDSSRDYTIGGVRVRDHRAGNQQKVDIPPNIHPPEGRQLPSELTQLVAQEVKAVMNDCVASVPREARGPAPRLEGQLLIAIKDHKISITSATMQLRDVFGAAVEPTKACIEQKSVGRQVNAPDQADMDSYSINITFAIP
jgi:hypothetical protein